MEKNKVSVQWFKDNVTENVDEILRVGNAANSILHNVLSIGLNHPETTMAIYAHIFETICKQIALKEKTHTDYELNIADGLCIGYDTTEDENDEKQGNFMVYMRHKENPGIDAVLDEDETNTLALCAIWNAQNIKEQAAMLKQISVEACKTIGSVVNIKFESEEFIIPLFSIIHAQIIRYVRTQRIERNLREYELPICGLYTVGVSVNDDAVEEVYFIPSITLKLLFKNDCIASATDED